MKRRAAIGIAGLDSGPSLEERGHDTGVGHFRCEQQRWPPQRITLVGISARLQQQSRTGRMSGPDGTQERGVAIGGGRVRSSAVGERFRHARQVPSPRRVDDRRHFLRLILGLVE